MFSYPLVSIASIGWIPYYRKLAHLPDGPAKRAINDQPQREKWGYDLLFYSGNDTPDSNLFNASNEVPFREYLKNKDYRGALALWNVSLKISPPEQPSVEVKPLDAEEELGYTAVRPLPFKTKWVALFTQGEHKVYGRSDRLSSEPTANGVQFRHNIIFKVGWKANLGAKVFLRHDIPYVSMRIVYLVDFGGPVFTTIDKCRIGINVAATYVPSHQHWDMAFSQEAEMIRLPPPPHYSHTHSIENNDLGRLEDVFANDNSEATQFFECKVEYGWDVPGSKWKRLRSATWGLP